MGVAGLSDLGLWIKTVDVDWDLNRDLVRISEVGVIAKFGEVTVPASLSYRPKGLKIGMQFRNSHQVGPAGQNSQIEFAAGPKGTTGGWVWTPVPQHTGANSVTAKLGEVFGAPPGTTWRGYRITSQMFAPYPAPSPGNEADERLYFRVLIRNFSPHIHPPGNYQVNDVHVVPMVCILGDIPSFSGHYALGIGAFTVGHGAGAIQFDSEVIAHDVPIDAAAPVLPPVPGAKRPPADRRPPGRRPPKVTLPRRPKPPKGPRPPRPGPDPGPVRNRRRSPAKRRKR